MNSLRILRTLHTLPVLAALLLLAVSALTNCNRRNHQTPDLAAVCRLQGLRPLGPQRCPPNTVCGFDVLPPASFGLCMEAAPPHDYEVVCLRQGVITYYNADSQVVWSQPAALCPELGQQLQRQGQDHIELSVPLPAVPSPPPDTPALRHRRRI